MGRALLASLLLHGILIAMLARALPGSPPVTVRPTLLLWPADSLSVAKVSAADAITPAVPAPKPAALAAGDKQVHKPQPPVVPAPQAADVVSPVQGHRAAAPAPSLGMPGPEAGTRPASPPAEKVATSHPESVRQDVDRNLHVPAKVVFQPDPDYPSLSREQGEEGVVTLRLELGAAGGLKSVSVLHSSGFVRLDRAARNGVWRWRFAPAVSNGQSMPAKLDVPVYFRLDSGG